jgi:hypothetical protein
VIRIVSGRKKKQRLLRLPRNVYFLIDLTYPLREEEIFCYSAIATLRNNASILVPSSLSVRKMRTLTLVSYLQVLLCIAVLSTATAFNDVDDAQPILSGRKRNRQQQQQPSQSALLPPQPQGNTKVAPLLLDNVEILSNIEIATNVDVDQYTKCS